MCGKLHQLLVVYEADGRLFDFKVMSEGGRKAAHPTRPLAACEKHTAAEVEAAVKRMYGEREEED